MPLCFAYGSNMDRSAMAARCPASQAIGPAKLMRHRLVLMREGYLSVAPDAAGVVHGLLWQLDLRDVAALDRYEGVAEGLYGKSYKTVIARAGARRSLVYCGGNGGPGRAQPGYLEAVIAAARALGLPQGCLAELQALAGRREPAAAAGDLIHGRRL